MQICKGKSIFVWCKEVKYLFVIGKVE